MMLMTRKLPPTKFISAPKRTYYQNLQEKSYWLEQQHITLYIRLTANRRPALSINQIAINPIIKLTMK